MFSQVTSKKLSFTAMNSDAYFDKILKARIFVSIPSYRDPELADTIKDIWKKARVSDRISIGVCQQISLKDKDLDVRRIWPNHPRLFVDTIPHTEAKGPCLARQRIEQFLLTPRKDDFEFVLCVDAHMVFCNDWDARILADWYACDDINAILTTYPKAYGKNRKWSDTQVGNFLTTHSWNKNRLPLFALRSYARNPSKPVPSVGWVAGFSFSPSHTVHNVPYLDNVPYLFIGEEIAMGVRYWTSGYNMYSPTFCCAQTTYKHTGKHKFDELKFDRSCRVVSESFVKKLVGISCGSIDGYPSSSRLGSARTLAAFESYSGIKLSASAFTINSMAGITSDDTEETVGAKWRNKQDMENHVGKRYFFTHST